MRGALRAFGDARRRAGARFGQSVCQDCWLVLFGEVDGAVSASSFGE
jgi:hypothetical protein